MCTNGAAGRKRRELEPVDWKKEIRRGRLWGNKKVKECMSKGFCDYFFTEDGKRICEYSGECTAQKAITNGDVIREMSDTGLAKLFGCSVEWLGSEAE